ncbi:MAG: MgtC/SapB family protein, partial [Micromonosporaceae bacterium]
MGSAWQSAAVALAIGLLIGSERERSGSAGGSLAGVRTFGLAALAGCAAALIAPAVLAAAVLGAGALVAVGYFRTAASDAGLTTEVALVLAVVLGGLAVTRPALAAAAGVATAVVLLSRDRLHRFVREHITDIEMTDALKFFVVAFIVLPLVPHAHLGPDGVIDPRTIWTLVVAVTALGWLGYVAVRVLGPRRGLPMAGLAGGFVSGAATTGAMARLARNSDLHRPALAAALLASVATLVQLVIVTAVADPRVAATLAPAAGLGALVLAGEAVWLSRRPRPGASSVDDFAGAAAEATVDGGDTAAPPAP